jgi:NAD(P)-dependent dehydrogenase (short-subunit alcohol dehydrogenase family)
MTAAKDLAQHNIRVNTVCPGLIGPENGYMWLRQIQLRAQSGSPYFKRDPEEEGTEALSRLPLRRLGEVSEVVQAVAFLLSDDSSFITGTSLVVAGGGA